MPHPGVIVQARMGSARLPGKVMRPLAGIPMIGRILARLRRMREIKVVILATTNSPNDDVLAAYAETWDVPIFRGSGADVLDRYYRCAHAFDLDPVVRATGDNPFVDPEEGDRLFGFFCAHGLDYAANVPPLGGELPIGIGLEIMNRTGLDRSWREGLAPNHREHVTEYIQERPDLFRRAVPPTPAAKCAPGLRLTVDTTADFALAERLILAHAATAADDQDISTEWLVAHVSHPATAIAMRSGDHA